MKLPEVELISSEITLEGVKVTTYGLKRGEIEISDISTDAESVQRLIDAINKVGDVADEHLLDIVEDSINWSP